MIGQYLSNNNEKRYSAILPKNLDLNRPIDSTGTTVPLHACKREDTVLSSSYKSVTLQKILSIFISLNNFIIKIYLMIHLIILIMYHKY
jgi:hypothetical protein